MRVVLKRAIIICLAGIFAIIACLWLCSGTNNRNAESQRMLPDNPPPGSVILPESATAAECAPTAADAGSDQPAQHLTASKTPSENYNGDAASSQAEESNIPAMQLQVEGGGSLSPTQIKEAAIRERFGAIRRGGKWIPITGDSTNLVYITTGALPAGRVNTPYSIQFAAESGQPPYSWRITDGMLPPGLTLDTNGELTGSADTPSSTIFRLTVTDSRGAEDVAEYLLTITPETPLEILTANLPAATPGDYYSCQLEATGGVPPYLWSAESDLLTLGVLTLNQLTGEIAGEINSNAPPSDIPITVWLHDAQQSITRQFMLHIRTTPDIIATPTAPIRQGHPFNYAFQAAGGIPPYTWSMAALPPGLHCAPDGIVSGTPDVAGKYEIIVMLQDAAQQSDTKQFTLTVLPSDPGRISNLTAFLGRTRVALTWEFPDNPLATVRIVKTLGTPPSQATDGETIYHGGNTEYLDENIAPGAYYYAAFLEESGVTVTNTPPPVLQVRMPPKLEPFADRVVAKQLLHPNAFRSAELPGIVLGPPRGAGLAYGSADVVSLGAAVNDDNGASAPYGGAITLEFVDNAIWNGPGDDFTIFENVFYIYDANGRPDPTTRFMEPAVVSVSQDGVTWHQFPTDFSPRYDPVSGKLNLHHPYCYRTGFAGVNPVMSNGLDPDPTDPAVSGGDSFDIGTLGLDWIRFVRIQSTGSRWLTDSDGDLIYHIEKTSAATRSDIKSGFDLDAAAAIWSDRITAD